MWVCSEIWTATGQSRFCAATFHAYLPAGLKGSRMGDLGVIAWITSARPWNDLDLAGTRHLVSQEFHLHPLSIWHSSTRAHPGHLGRGP